MGRAAAGAGGQVREAVGAAEAGGDPKVQPGGSGTLKRSRVQRSEAVLNLVW
eukprot:SAG31_NODE_371_length_16628_cov_3.741943_4_plen_52_part_00